MSADNLRYRDLTSINMSRAHKWHPDFFNPSSPNHWNGADWSNAMCGEAGEAANVVKKIRRIETGVRGRADDKLPKLIDKLGGELADTMIYIDLLASYYRLDLPACIIVKFNEVSVREGWPERLAL